MFIFPWADCWKVFLASQSRCTTLNAVQDSMCTASPSHRPGFDGASILTPRLLISSCWCLRQGHLPITKAAASATARLASLRGQTRLIVGVLHKSRLLTTLYSVQHSMLTASLRYCLGSRSSPSHHTRVVTTLRP